MQTQESTLQQQLQQIPNLTRYQYASSGAVLASTFEPIAQSYQHMCTHIMQQGQQSLSEQDRLQLKTCEGKLTWLVYLIGAQIGGHMTMASAGREGHELTDASMSRGVFQLMGIVDRMMSTTQGQLRCDRCLEKSLLFFFTEFRRCYVGEHHGMPSAKETAIKKRKDQLASTKSAAMTVEEDSAMDTSGTSGDTSTLARSILMARVAAAANGGPGGSGGSGSGSGGGRSTSTASGAVYGATGRLLQAGAAAGNSVMAAILGGSGARSKLKSGREKTKTTAERKREMYERMFETMGIGDHTVVIDTLVQKVRNNLTYWSDDHEVIQHTLSVFYWLSAGYNSGTFMLSLNSVQQLLVNHGPLHLRFLTHSANTRERTEFYKTLARLVFIGDADKLLRPFMVPVITVLQQVRCHFFNTIFFFFFFPLCFFFFFFFICSLFVCLADQFFSPSPPLYSSFLFPLTLHFQKIKKNYKHVHHTTPQYHNTTTTRSLKVH